MKKRAILVLSVLLLPGCYISNLPINMGDLNATTEIGRGARVTSELNADIDVEKSVVKSNTPNDSPAPITVIGTPMDTPITIIGTPGNLHDPNAWIRTKFYPGDAVTGVRRGWNVEYDPGSGQILSAALPGNASSPHYLINPVVPNDLMETIHLNKYMVSRQIIVYNISGK
ncbi:hypothetical protein D3C87_1113720 [compost metagenome]